MTPSSLGLRQLALRPAWLLAGLACASGEATAGLDPQPVVASIAVAASPAAINAGEVALLRATGTTASGSPTAVEVDWTATGGQVVIVSDSQAHFTATAPGSYWVHAQERLEPYPTDSILIQVLAPLSPLIALRVTPESLALLPAATVTFSVEGTRADGSIVVPLVVWSATGGSVTSSGQYSAGATPGTYRVIASQLGGTLADTAVVVISASTGGGTGFANEPAGLVTPYTIAATQPNPFNVLPRFWNANDGRGRYDLDDYGWSIEAGGGETGDPSRWSIVNDAERGNVLNLELRAGDPGGSSPVGGAVAGGGHSKGLSWAPDGAPFEVKRLFLGYWVKLSPNWTDPNVEMKHLYFNNTYTDYTSNDGNWYIALSNKSRPYLHAGIQVQHPGTPTYQLDGASASRGAWHKFEMYAVMNTVGAANGSVKIWIDGVLAANWTGLMLANRTPNVDWLKFGILTGGGGNPVPADAYVRFDDWYVKVGS